MAIKIIWGVDAFGEQNAIQKIEPVINRLTAGFQEKVEVIPTYVLTPGPNELYYISRNEWFGQYRPASEKALTELKERSKVNFLGSSEIVEADSQSTNSAAYALSEFCSREKADYVIISTHAREGLSRFFLGSFAETFMLQYDGPTFVVNPSVDFDRDMKTILFPTDFSDASKSIFEKIIQFAKARESQIVLFHQIPRPIQPVLNSAAMLFGGTFDPNLSYLENEVVQKNNFSRKWEELAKKSGVKVKTLISDLPRPVNEAILESAKSEGADIIAMASESGLVAATLIGSVARQVVRESKVPVWINHCTFHR